MKIKIKNICCIGAGYVGGPTMAVIADNCHNVEINVVDLDRERIDRWNSKDLSRLPVYEPGLAEIIERRRGKNLNFSSSVEEKIKIADAIFISVNTPTKKKGLGAGKASDLKWIEACTRQVAANSEGHTIVIEKSTIPVRTANVIKSILESSEFLNDENSNKTFSVLSNPEFLAEGTAINDLLNPDRILIGGDNYEDIESLKDIYANWVPNHLIISTNVWSSELSKLSANAFLAQRISSINSISALCEKTGADVEEVSLAIGLDTRIGSKFLKAGPGFGGSCFKKDILNVIYLCEYFGLHEVAEFWESVIKLNNWQTNRITKLVTRKLFGTLSNKKISILGFAFKANTNDTRESAAIQICKNLINEGAILLIHDPKVNGEQIALDLNNEEFDINKSEIGSEGTWIKVNDIYDSFVDSDASIILTEWEEYLNINWDKVSNLMRKPAWVFDTRSMIDKKNFDNLDLNLWVVGKG